MRKIFVTGIDTDVGKTIVSAILTEAMQADYWKPVQAGSTELTDTERVKRLVESQNSFFHPEGYLLKNPMSPHAAAELEEVKIRMSKLRPPETENTMVIEGAGGLLVPLNYKKDTMLDVIKQCEAEVVVVSKNYLGSINHTLMTLEVLKFHDIKLLGVIFNGEENEASETAILEQSGVKCLGRVKQEYEFTRELIKEYARDYVFI